MGNICHYETNFRQKKFKTKIIRLKRNTVDLNIENLNIILD